MEDVGSKAITSSYILHGSLVLDIVISGICEGVNVTQEIYKYVYTLT